MKKKLAHLVSCLLCCSTIPILWATPSHSSELFGSFFGKKNTPNHQKLTVIPFENVNNDITEREQSLNCGFVSPVTFQTFFEASEEYGYLRLYNEYAQLKKNEYDESAKQAKGVICVRPHNSLQPGLIVINSFLSKMLLQLDGKSNKLTNAEIDFMPVLAQEIGPAGYINMDIKIITSEKDLNNKELYGKLLQQQINTKFQYIPLTQAMNNMVFKFTMDELASLPSIQEIHCQLKGYSRHTTYITSSTNIRMTLQNPTGFSINPWKEPRSQTFDHLIKQPEVSEQHRLITTYTPKVEELVLDDLEDDPDHHSLQIKKLNLDFQSLGIGGLDDQLNEIVRRGVLSRGVAPEVLDKLGITEHTKGIILSGPPGTGKTLIARKLSEMLGVPDQFFLTINGPEVLSKYVGESEENIRKLFAVAERNPKQLIVIFFDEMDAIASRRSSGSGTGEKVGNNLVNQLLAKMDGAKKINNVLVIGATNRLDIIDPALLRPGRFSIQLHIGLPAQQGRRDIFNIYLKTAVENKTLQDVDLDLLASKTQNYTGAEIKGLCDEAKSFALQEAVIDPQDLSSVDASKLMITMDHFIAAFSIIQPVFGQHNLPVSDQLPIRNISLPSQTEFLRNVLYRLQTFRPGKVSTILITGDNGTGKSALAGALAEETKNDFNLTRIITPTVTKKSFIDQLDQVWQDAQRVDKSLIILDGLEHLLRMFNQYKYDEHAMITLNTMLTAKTLGKIVLIATMATAPYQQLFSLVNPTAKWHFHSEIPSLNKEDITSILHAHDINHQGLITLLENRSITNVLDIINVEQPSQYGLENWKHRIAALTDDS